MMLQGPNHLLPCSRTYNDTKYYGRACHKKILPGHSSACLLVEQLQGRACGSDWRKSCSLAPHRLRPRRRENVTVRAADPLVPLGFDFLTFLGATVLVIPLFKRLKISPVLGFLFSGLVLQQLRLLHDLKDVERLSELGVLFLLFEMGLELSLGRLKALAKYAFGMGSLQVLICTVAFTLIAVPVGQGLGTRFLEVVCHASPNLVSIRTIDEAVIVGAALSLSSSAFVLQLLSERGEQGTRFGSATLGILLFQDIAVVPFLVLLPLFESDGMNNMVIHNGAEAMSLVKVLLPTFLQTAAGLGCLLLGGRLFLRRLFEVVAQSRSAETFVALCLLTVTGASLLTQKLGLSDSMGAFTAGVLLSETSYRTQVEADIRPFRGLLLGLFFVSVGSSINMSVLMDNYDVIFWMLLGLIAFKTTVTTALGPLCGLTKNESIRTGFLLSQGGEFAFVLLSLANQLKVLPNNLNEILIIVVVLSMALTPTLADLGQQVADKLDPPPKLPEPEPLPYPTTEIEEPQVVIIGFGPQGQMLANMLESPLVQKDFDGVPNKITYVAFDMDPARVRSSRQAGFHVLYGDGARISVLKAAGVVRPKAVVVCYSIRHQAIKTVATLRQAFPGVPLYACASDLRHAAELEDAGADAVVISTSEAGLALGEQLLTRMGVDRQDVSALKREIENVVALRTHLLAEQIHIGGEESGGPLQSDFYMLDALSQRSRMSMDAEFTFLEGDLPEGEITTQGLTPTSGVKPEGASVETANVIHSSTTSNSS